MHWSGFRKSAVNNKKHISSAAIIAYLYCTVSSAICQKFYFSLWPRSCEWATQLHSPRPLPRHVHSIMWPMTSCRLSHLSPTRCIAPSLVVHNSSWATWRITWKKVLSFVCLRRVFCVHSHSAVCVQTVCVIKGYVTALINYSPMAITLSPLNSYLIPDYLKVGHSPM